MRQSLSGLFLLLSVSPARPRRTFGYTDGPFLPASFADSLFVATESPAFAGSFFPFLFLFSRAFARAFPFSLFLFLGAISLTGLPNQGSAWLLPSCGGSIPLQWSPDLVRRPCPFGQAFACPSLFRSTKGASFPFQGCLFKKQALV